MTRNPMIYIDSEWTEDIKELTVYSNCDEIELFVNGKPMGRYQPSKALKYIGLDHPPFKIKVDGYEPGQLMAKGYIQGVLSATKAIHTPQSEAAIRLVVDTVGRQFVADGSDILVAYAEIIDKNGTIITGSDSEVRFSVKGDAQVVGHKEKIGSNPLRAKHGVAPVLIRAGNRAGEIALTASVKGLKSVTAEVQSIPDNVDITLSKAYPIFDFDEVKVDMGAESQLVQFDWTAWNGVDNQASTFKIEGMNNATATINTLDVDGVLRWLGEMNVIGKFGFVYGEGLLGISRQGVALRFDGLPKGNYRLTTYHHAPSSNTDSMDPNLERLKNENIHKLPYAKLLQAEISDMNGSGSTRNIQVTEGKELQFEEPGKGVFNFSSDGNNPVEIIFKSQTGSNGVWLNGFELRRWM